MDVMLLVVGDSYGEACAELCKAYGVFVEADDRPPEAFLDGQEPFLAVLALAGEGFQLTSVLAVDQGLLAATHAANALPSTDVDLEDWCREFSNQLGGRLKNKLLLLGLELQVGLSTLVHAPPVPPAGAPAEVRRCAFTGRKGWLRGELSTSAAPDAWPQRTPQEEPLREGTSLMF